MDALRQEWAGLLREQRHFLQEVGLELHEVIGGQIGHVQNAGQSADDGVIVLEQQQIGEYDVYFEDVDDVVHLWIVLAGA